MINYLFQSQNNDKKTRAATGIVHQQKNKPTTCPEVGLLFMIFKAGLNNTMNPLAH